MSNQGELYDSLESIVAKLYVLRDSCTGIMHTDKSNPNLIWFRGAETLLQEAVEELQKALGALESGEAAEPQYTCWRMQSHEFTHQVMG